MYGLKPHTIKAIQDVFAKHKAIEKAILYGSRAKGNYRNGSDIDLTLVGKTLTLSQQFSIETDLDDLLLPYKIDLSIFHKIENEDLIDHINRVGINLYEKENEWSEEKLGDLIEIKYGKDHKKLNKGSIPCFGSGGIMRYVDSQLYNDESILIPRKGSLNNIMYQNNPFWTVDTMFWSKINKAKVFPKFLYYQLTLIDYKILNVGSAVPSLTVSVLNDIDVTIPLLPEQKAIANALSSLDNKIDLLHRQNETLEALAETLFRKYFIEEAKESWELKKLEDILTISSSKRIFYKEYVDSGIPFYRSKEIIELRQKGSTNSKLFITEDRFNEVNEKFGSPVKNDILLTSVGTLGVSYRVKENNKFYFKDGNLTWFKEFKELSSIIIYCWLNSDFGKECLNEITIGSTQAALTISGLRNIELNIPTMEIQNFLNKELDSIYDKIDKNLTQIQTLVKLRDTLLPKLMSGEVRMQL